MCPRTTLVAAALLSLAVLNSCSSKNDPYDDLTNDASRYVVPDSEEWSSGELCKDGGDCSGPITIPAIEMYDWFRITDLELEGDLSGRGSVSATLRVAEARSAAPGEPTVTVRIWGPDVGAIEDVLAEGFDVWAGVEGEHARVFCAFDADGRFAAIGHAAAEHFTVPVARLADEAAAPSGFAFLDPIMATVVSSKSG